MSFQQKYVHSLPAVERAGRYVKRYHITRQPDGAIGADIAEAAYLVADKLLPAPDGEMPPAGWTVLHEGKDAMYLCVYSWVWGNAVHSQGASAGEPDLGCQDKDLTNFVILSRPLVGCVWELPTMAHERTAWVRHMLSPELPDLDGYLADTLPDGPIG